MKKILLSILGVVALLLIIAALMPKDFKIEKEIVINKPKAEVFNYLQYAKNSESWCPWAKKDPNMTHEYKGQDGTVGFISSWSGNKEVGVGEQEITNIVPNEKIESELRFTEPMKATHKAYLITESVSETETKVIWGMTGRTEFPFNLVCFFMQKQVQKEFSNGLNSLKEILENGAPVAATDDAAKPAAEATSETVVEEKK